MLTQPDFEDCCGNGCEPCIFDLHDLAMDRSHGAIPRRHRQRMLGRLVCGHRSARPPCPARSESRPADLCDQTSGP
ncbi:oxidoreductase-like domain-containing protein [Variovorax sp. J22R24]|nr:oxidoreductase-like domain-containing protein [Variovorax sp. J22R24]MDM0106563.1 oxidoreductase-like domain-containing protein [Variovorax sp. J22R24]